MGSDWRIQLIDRELFQRELESSFRIGFLMSTLTSMKPGTLTVNYQS